MAYSSSPIVNEATISTLIPQPGNTTPPATALDGNPGTSTNYARKDHTHATTVQRVSMVTEADGTATWTFARPIACPKGVVPPFSSAVDDTSTPVVVQVISRAFTTSADQQTDIHTGLKVKAQRARTLPATIAVLSTLFNFDVFGGSASGVKVSLWVSPPTQ